MKRWIDADSHNHTQEIAEKWVEVLNTDPSEYRGYELRTAENKETAIDQLKDVAKGGTMSKGLLKSISTHFEKRDWHR